MSSRSLVSCAALETEARAVAVPGDADETLQPAGGSKLRIDPQSHIWRGMGGGGQEEPLRFVADGFLSPEECRELCFIAEGCGVVGYRPHVRSCTLHDLISGRSTTPLIMPLLRLRERARDLVEAKLGMEAELLHEFTGLISWGPGSSIGWHHDSNAEYLLQRAVSAVVYLNGPGQEGGFSGGTFQFSSPPLDVTPKPGRVVGYTAGESNVHRVQEVAGPGWRHTVALWFSRLSEHDEDQALLRSLSTQSSEPGSWGALPPSGVPLPSPMFFDTLDGGADIRRRATVALLGPVADVGGKGLAEEEDEAAAVEAALGVMRSLGFFRGGCEPSPRGLSEVRQLAAFAAWRGAPGAAASWRAYTSGLWREVRGNLEGWQNRGCLLPD